MLASVRVRGWGIKKVAFTSTRKVTRIITSFESSPYCSTCREYLCELKIPYVLQKCGRTEWSGLLPPC